MTRRVDHSLLMALSLSLLLHGGSAWVLMRFYDPGMGGFLSSPAAARKSAPPDQPILIPDAQRLIARSPEAPALPPLPAPPAPAPVRLALSTPPLLPPIMEKPVAPPLKLPDIQDIPKPSREFGEARGKGRALHSSPGEQPMQAPRGPQDQAFISRDDIGKGNPQEKPGTDTKAESQPQPPAQPPAPKPVKPAEPEQPLRQPAKLPQELPQGAGALVANVALPKPPSRDSEARQPAPARTSATQPVQATSPLVAGRDQARSAGNSADPAPRSDSESDAFSTTGAATFRPGSVEARFGRKVKTVRPRLTLAGQYDLLSLTAPEVVMLVKVDETGRVRQVKVIKSSGSSEVDHPCELAMYEWWFEPLRDAAGKPQPAELTWTFTWSR